MSFDVDEKTGKMLRDFFPLSKRDLMIIKFKCKLSKIKDLIFGIDEDYKIPSLDELPRFEDEFGFPKKPDTSSNKLNVDDKVLEEILKDCENFVYPDDEEYEPDFYPEPKLWQKILLMPVMAILYVIDRIRYGKEEVEEWDDEL